MPDQTRNASSRVFQFIQAVRSSKVSPHGLEHSPGAGFSEGHISASSTHPRTDGCGLSSIHIFTSSTYCLAGKMGSSERAGYPRFKALMNMNCTAPLLLVNSSSGWYPLLCQSELEFLVPQIVC